MFISLPSPEIAVGGGASPPHRYFWVLYAYFFGGKGVANVILAISLWDIKAYYDSYQKNYLNLYKTMDILSLGWFGVLGMFTLSIAFVVWGRNGL